MRVLYLGHHVHDGANAGVHRAHQPPEPPVDATLTGTALEVPIAHRIVITPGRVHGLSPRPAPLRGVPVL